MHAYSIPMLAGADGASGFGLETVPLFLVLLIGLMLWLVGRRILRPAFAAAGLLFGGILGWVIGELFAGTMMALWLFAGLGGVVFCLAAVAAYRLAVAVGLGLTLGILAPLAVWSGVELGLISVEHLPGERTEESAPQDETPTTDDSGEHPEDPDADEPDEPADSSPDGIEDWENLPGPVRDWLEELLRHGRSAPRELPVDQLQDLDPEELEKIRQMQEDGELEGMPEFPIEGGLDHIQRAEDAARHVIDRFESVWQSIPAELRPTLLLTGVVAALLGFLIGVVAVTFAASTVTALAGGMIVLASSYVLLERFGIESEPWLPASAPSWMGWWLAISLIGLGVQWMTTPNQTDRNRDS